MVKVLDIKVGDETGPNDRRLFETTGLGDQCNVALKYFFTLVEVTPDGTLFLSQMNGR